MKRRPKYCYKYPNGIYYYKFNLMGEFHCGTTKTADEGKAIRFVINLRRDIRRRVTRNERNQTTQLDYKSYLLRAEQINKTAKRECRPLSSREVEFLVDERYVSQWNSLTQDKRDGYLILFRSIIRSSKPHGSSKQRTKKRGPVNGPFTFPNKKPA